MRAHRPHSKEKKVIREGDLDILSGRYPSTLGPCPGMHRRPSAEGWLTDDEASAWKELNRKDKAQSRYGRPMD